MSESRKSPVQNRLRSMLLRDMTAVCSRKPIRISERAIARKYNTTAITVHAVCEDLARLNLLIRIPGKRGYFINPERMGFNMSKLYLGVISSRPASCDNISFDGRTFQQLSAVMEALQDQLGSITFCNPKCSTPEEITGEIASLPLNGYLWLAPSEKDLEIFHNLIRMGIPVLAVSEIFDTTPWKAPESNALIRDYYTMGVMRAHHLLQQGCSTPLYIGSHIPGKTFDGFCDTLHQNHIPFRQEQRLDFTPDLVQKAALFCKTCKPDSIVANGPILQYIDELLRELPFLKEVPFFTEGTVLEKKASEYKLKRISTMSFERLFRKSGKTIAGVLKNLIENKVASFENRILTEEEIFASGIRPGKSVSPVSSHKKQYK